MSTEDEKVVDSAETTTTEAEELEVTDTSNDEDTGEDEVAETTESRKQQTTETPEQRRARIKRQYEREFGKQDKGETKEENKEDSSKVEDDRYARLELKMEGVTSKKAQDVVLDYAKFKGIDVSAALKSPIVKGELAELEKKTSSPAPSKRTSTGATDSFEYWVSQAKKGNFPRHDKAMMAQLKKARIWTS